MELFDQEVLDKELLVVVLDRHEELDGDGSLSEVLEPDGSWVTGEDPGESASQGVESFQDDRFDTVQIALEGHQQSDRYGEGR